MKVLVDIDGVTVDLVKSILTRLNQKFGTDFKHEHIRTWDFFSSKSTYNLLSEEQKQYVREIMCEPQFASNVDLLPAAKKGLEKVKRNGCDITFLTAPWKDSPTWIEDRRAHLTKELGHISTDIVFSWNKEETPGDLLIDDNPAFLRLWLHANHKAHKQGDQVLLFNQPWNQDNNTDNFTVMNDWNDPILLNTIFAHKVLR
jgi:5'(3')-deoxyribonucleotidase